MMDKVIVETPAKINLSLRVGDLRDDGYHELSTVFLAVGLTDTITVTDQTGEITLSLERGDAEMLGPVESNLAVRAARLLRDTHGDPSLGAHINIEKRIPVAGGMAGGSADAAGALLACSELWGLKLERSQLMELGARLGADVPFALLGGVALGRGRGDELAPLLHRGSHTWVIAHQSNGISTPEAFRRLDLARAEGRSPSVDSEGDVIRALLTGDSAQLAAALSNDFQEVIRQSRPEINQLLELAGKTEALGVILSGSGPSVAYLCENEAAAHRVAKKIQQLVPVQTMVLHSPVPGAWVSEWGSTLDVA